MQKDAYMFKPIQTYLIVGLNIDKLPLTYFQEANKCYFDKNSLASKQRSAVTSSYRFIALST